MYFPLVLLIEEEWRQKPWANSRRCFLGKMAAHLDSVADEWIKVGRVSITVTYVLIKTGVLLKFLTLSRGSLVDK